MCSGMRDGQEVMNFLFDVINDCAGYTDKYYDEIIPGPDRHFDYDFKYPKEGRM